MNTKTILTLAFFEGVSVMIIELLGGKMLVPYFGNSLIIWTSTIGVTMSSLMIGYYLGGKISGFKNKQYYLYFFLLASTIWMMVMPFMVKPIFNIFNGNNLYLASIFSAAFLFALPLILFGSCPPILISLLANKESAGLTSGRIFGVSTLGSILCALIIGFLIINKYGISYPLTLYGLLFFLIFTLLLWNSFKEKIYYLIFALPIVFILLIKVNKTEDSRYLYISENLQGQIKIFEEFIDGVRTRYLQVNGISQTKNLIFPDNPILNQSGWFYVHFDGAIASHKSKGSEALLMGFGAGSIALELVNLGFKVDVAEFDERLPAIAHDYFLFDTSRVDFYIDDARHFIKKQKDKKKYDIVVIDILHGEVQPNHIFTLEGLKELKNILNYDATLIVNFQSNSDETQQPFLSILNTFWKANYDAIVIKPKDDRPADYIFVASPSTLPLNLYDFDHMNSCCYNHKFVQNFIKNPSYITKESSIVKEFKNFTILRDDKPVLEIMNKESIHRWRKHMIENNKEIKSTIFK